MACLPYNVNIPGAAEGTVTVTALLAMPAFVIITEIGFPVGTSIGI
jgi:hypothetical protein